MEYLHLAVAIACNMGWYDKVVINSAIPFTTDDDFRIRVNNTTRVSENSNGILSIL